MPATDKEIQDAATMMFEHLEGQISRADTEAQLTLAVDAILVAAITSFLSKGIGTELLNWNVMDLKAINPIRIEAVFAIAAVVALLVSLYFALAVTKPKLTAPSATNLFYFGSIVTVKSAAKFEEQFRAQTQVELVKGLLDEVYAKAEIAKRKFYGISWSVTFLIVALACWAMVESVLTFA